MFEGISTNHRRAQKASDPDPQAKHDYWHAWSLLRWLTLMNPCKPMFSWHDWSIDHFWSDGQGTDHSLGCPCTRNVKQNLHLGARQAQQLWVRNWITELWPSVGTPSVSYPNQSPAVRQVIHTSFGAKRCETFPLKPFIDNNVEMVYPWQWWWLVMANGG